MWVLNLQEGCKAAEQQAAIYLTSGEISIGRPLKKGSTVGKADILIFNEQSVSTIHAKLHVEAAEEQVDFPFEHGALTITGTLYCRRGQLWPKHNTMQQVLMLTKAVLLHTLHVLLLCCRRQQVWHAPHQQHWL